MVFAHPLALLWALLVVPVVVLHLRHSALRREPVATAMIWEQVLAEERARSAWQRWRQPASLAIQLVLLMLVVVALADPQVPRPRQVVLVVDASARMNAAEVKPSRLEQAKETARRMIAGLRDVDRMAILSAGSPATVRCALGSDQAVLQEALDGIGPGDGPSDMSAAVAAARRILSHGAGGRIVILTDACFGGAAELAAADDVEMIRVGMRAGNAAITRLQPRRTTADPRVCQVLAEVRSFSDQPINCQLEVQLDGRAVATEPIELAPNGRWQKVLEISAPAAGRLTARLDRSDGYAADNEASASVPTADDTTLGAAGHAAWQSLPIEPPAAREGDLRAPGNLGIDAAEVAGGRPGLPLWLYLVGVCLVLFVVEWRLYQRRWIS